MQTPSLPEAIDPRAFCHAGKTLSGVLDLAAFGRLTAELGPQAGQARYMISFGVDEFGVEMARGRIDTAVVMTCSRCLEPVTITPACEIAVCFVTEDSEESEYEAAYEPMLVSGGRVDVEQWLEDEILLSLPLAPTHESPPCQAADGGRNEAPVVRKRQPFADLETLRQRLRRH